MEHSRHLSRAISYTLGWQLAIKGLNSYCQIFLQWRQLILLWNFSYFKSIYWYCQIKGLGNFCDAFNTKCISLTCCCAVITLSSGRCMKRKTISKRSIPTNVARPTLNQQDPASARQLCKRLAGDNRTTKQQGDPRASLLLTSEKAVLCKIYNWTD